MHGVPRTVVTDQGKEFVNQIFEGIAVQLQMKHTTVTAYRPSANGIIERANYTLVNILRTLVENNRAIWDEMLPVATQTYNTAHHRVIRDSPYYLLHLRDPNVPYQMLEAERRPWYNVDEYKQDMAIIAKKVYERCATYIEEGREEMKKNYRKINEIKPLKIEDRRRGGQPLARVPNVARR